jgi:Na+/H+ antiporter NhaD/arsenite permease-like protein
MPSRLLAALLAGLIGLALLAPATGAQEATGPGTGAAATQEAPGLDDEAALAGGEGAHGEADAHGPAPPLFLVLPFVTLLLMIATGPLFYAHHWHHHYPKYAVGLGALVVLYYLAFLHTTTPLVHAAEEYISFIALLASLFIASGCILIKTDFAGTPRANTAMLLAGAVLSNFIGTTGASMLLIRPFLRLNRGRLQPYHVIFFIFIVSNVGGSLTPIGDPPLFLGFLRGVPFFWTVEHVWYIWLPTLFILLAVFYVLDHRNRAVSVREQAAAAGDPDIEPGEYTDVATVHTRRHLAVEGKRGFLWLAIIIGSVFLDPNVFGWVPDLHALFHLPFGIREIIMFGVCFAAYRTAKPEALRGNEFSFEPILEVAWLFVGIFLTMQPALELIRIFAADNAEALNQTTFYFGTGILSGVLDNAPTYVSFLSAAMGRFGLDVNVPQHVFEFALGHDPTVGFYEPATTFYLQAISVAAVFFGALTYIGNGPNFMVKAIAESAGVPTPSFVAYVVKYSLPLLIPIYVVIWFIFFSGFVVPIPAS